MCVYIYICVCVCSAICLVVSKTLLFVNYLTLHFNNFIQKGHSGYLLCHSAKLEMYSYFEVFSVFFDPSLMNCY